MKKIIGKDQILNSSDCYVFKADNMEILNRFLIMGTEGGSYYINERKLTIQCRNYS